MNILKKVVFQACLLGCLISGATFASQPEQEISVKDIQAVSDLYEQAASQSDQINANLQQILELVTAKKLKVSNVEKTRQDLKEIISFLDHQKNFTTQLTLENIDHLLLINKVCLEYFATRIPNKIDTISLQDLITKIEDFFNGVYSGSENPGTFDEILADNNTKLTKLSYACDTAGLSNINIMYRYLEEKNVFKNIQTTALVGGAILTGALILTYGCNQTVKSHGIDPKNGKEILKLAYDPITLKGGSYNFSLLARPINGIIENVVAPLAEGVSSMGYHLFPEKPLDVLAPIGAFLAPFSKDIWNGAKDKWNSLNNYLRGETGTAKNFLQKNSAKKVYFKDLINVAHLEKIAQEYIDYLKHPERYDRSGTAPSKAMLLVGPPQTGKSLFAAALQTAIEEEFKDSNKPVAFINVDRSLLNEYSIEEIFAIAQFHSPCILFIDEIDMLGADREKNPHHTGQLLTCMSGLNAGGSEKQVFVLAATNKPEQLDFALLQDGRFGKVIPFEYPKFAERKAILEKLIHEKSLNIPEDFIIQLAKETEGLSFNSMTRIITEAMRSAKQAMRLVKPADIDDAFDKEIRKISPYIAAQDNIQTKEAIAAHQAGKIASYIVCKAQLKLAKATIKPIIKKIDPKAGFELTLRNNSDNSELKKDEPFTKESYRLGGVFTYHEIDASELESNEDQNHEIMSLLAGKISQNMLLGKTYSKIFAEDIEQAQGMIHSICENPLLTKEEMLKQAHELETSLYAKIQELLYANKDLIEKIYKALLKYETLDRNMLNSFAQ